VDFLNISQISVRLSDAQTVESHSGLKIERKPCCPKLGWICQVKYLLGFSSPPHPNLPPSPPNSFPHSPFLADMILLLQSPQSFQILSSRILRKKDESVIHGGDWSINDQLMIK
jgi:hypothetical protein